MTSDYFDEALMNLDFFLKRCRETNIALRNEKCFMIMIGGIVLGHHVFATGIKVDPPKIEGIIKMEPPTTQKGV